MTPEPGPRSHHAPFGLSRDAWGRLVLIDADGRRHVGVDPVRAFPLSDSEGPVTLCDAEGHEVAHVGRLADLPTATRQVLVGELARREFMPVILRVVRTSSAEADPSDWDVVTDRGPARFTLNSEEDVRRLGPHRALITDSRGVRYLVPDTRPLDAYSRRVLERYF